MGWGIGTGRGGRDIGYMVPAICDHPDCDEEIDRGLGYVCGGMHEEEEEGCGLYFCGKHQSDHDCGRLTPKEDAILWQWWKLVHRSWAQWREENPAEVERLRQNTASFKPSEEHLDWLQDD